MMTSLTLTTLRLKGEGEVRMGYGEVGGAEEGRGTSGEGE